MAVHERKAPKKNPDVRSPKRSMPDLAKLMQVVFDMKAEMGCMRKAMINAGMSFEKSPNVQKPREQTWLNWNFPLEYENFPQMSKTFRKPARARNPPFGIPPRRI